MNHSDPDFKSFGVADFIDHPDFLRWVLTPDDELEVYWKAVRITYPDKSTMIDRARGVILSINLESKQLNSEEKIYLWGAINAQITTHNNKQPLFNRVWLRVAASLLIGTFLAFLAYFHRSNLKTVVHTDYAQVKILRLPDGSVVNLNSNSKITYSKNWDSDHVREVWIDGEAFFKVNHLHKAGPVKDGDRFFVHAHNLNVEVLGTSFNVRDRRGLVNVALITGKISLESKTSKSARLVMKPGDVIEYNNSRDTIIRKKDTTALYTAWKNGHLYFDKTPVRYVFRYIEDVYGYKIILKNTNIANRELSGEFDNLNQDALFKALSTTLNISIQKNAKDKILIIN